MIAVVLQVLILSNSIYATDDSANLTNADQTKMVKLVEADSSKIGDHSEEQPSVIPAVELVDSNELMSATVNEEKETTVKKDNEANINQTSKDNSSKEYKKKKKDLHNYLKGLSSKALTEELNKLTDEELYSYLREVKGYSDLQIRGEIPIINKNGNLFFYSNKRLNAYMATPKDNENYLRIQKQDSKKREKLMNQNVPSHELMNDRQEQEDNLIALPEARNEILALRDEYSKFYKLDDGTNQSLISLFPVHYRDGDKFKEISVNIKSDTDDSFEYASRENSFKTFFNSSLSLDNDILAKYMKSNMHGVMRQLEFKITGAKPTGETIKENKIKYHNVFPNVDVEYLINPVRLKENIYVNEPVTEINYEFLLKLDGVSPRINDTLDIEFIDHDTNEIVWMMERPYAEDSGINQLVTRDMHYDMQAVTIDNEEWVRLILVMDDPNFLTDATYPITIDPTIFPSTSNIRGIIENYDGAADYSNGYHLFGNAGQEYIVYMNFSLSSMPSNAIIDTAQLSIYPQGQLGSEISAYYTCRRVTANFNNATWYNKALVTTQNQVKEYSLPTTTKIFRIENLMNDALNAGGFHGVEITGDLTKETGFYTYTSHNPQLLLSYRINQEPEIHYCSMSDYTKLIGDNESWGVQIFITDDAPSHQLSTDFYINGIKTETKTGAGPVFNIPVAQLDDGLVTLKFISTDGKYSVEKTVNIYVDKQSPIISDVQLTVSETSVNMSVQAFDPGNFPMPSTPYSYGLNGTFGSYVSMSMNTFSNLLPSTAYVLGLKVRDEANQVTEKNYDITTKAITPTVSVSNIRSQAMNIDITDINGIETDYLIQVGSQYASATGTLVDTPEWIRFTDTKTVDLTGLESGQAYTITAKARNADQIETSNSASITVATIGEVPAVIQGLRAVIDINSATLHWNALVDATNYDVEINNQVIQVDINSYVILNIDMDTNYHIRVRGVNKNGHGDWSDYIEFTPNSIINVNAITGNNYYTTWQVNDYTTFTNKKFVLMYDKTVFELEDVYAYSYNSELTVGRIIGTDVDITSIEDGRIEFVIHKEVPSGQSYTGPINTIKLKALQTGEAIIKFEVIDIQ